MTDYDRVSVLRDMYTEIARKNYRGRTVSQYRSKVHVNLVNGNPATALDAEILNFFKKNYIVRLRYRGNRRPDLYGYKGDTLKNVAHGVAIYVEDIR